VLVPTAYGNVTRMAVAYAQLLPHQQFLMVATRPNAKEFVPPENVQVRDLAEYADAPQSTAERASLMERWTQFREDIKLMPELGVLAQAGFLESVPGWIRGGLSVRNAWQQVLRREPVQAVLCGDDSNRYTRLPVLLAAKRKIPTIDFHHGALDGHYLLKTLPCDIYLAKNEMERDYQVRVCGLPRDKVVVAAPASQSLRAANNNAENENIQRTSAVLFSEPYDVVGMRSEEVYREILPPLCRLAREHGRDVIIKLHPFESRTERDRLLRRILAREDYALVNIVDGPLSEELMAKAWFGVTVESTTALDCLQNGVACFLCEWLTLSPYEYPEQYARFGVGEVLESVEQMESIPRRVEEFRQRPPNRSALRKRVNPAILEEWLTCNRHEPSAAQRAIS
jgi:hypothetical protein